MKKVLVFLLACFTCSSMFAQTQCPWSQTAGPECANTNTSFRFFLYINSEYVSDPTKFQIGVFDQNEICRGTKLPTWVNSKQWYYYNITCKGYAGCEYHFRIWDTELGEERTDLVLNNISDYTEFVWQSGNYSYGSGVNPFYLNFDLVGGGFEKEIVGYGNSTNGGYYLIASPVGQVSPTQVSHMTTDAFDLYYFDQNPADGKNEWINYKNEGGEVNAYFGDLMPGKGYLYAKVATDTIVFDGSAFTSSTNDTTIWLEYSENTEFSGWNLVGNPFGDSATIDKPFYRLNSDGNGLNTETETSSVNVMEGVFVQATGANQSVKFTPAAQRAQSNVPQANIMVTSDRGTVIDNAILRFDGGNTLEKFQLNPSNTKVYIPQDNRNYAVVTAEEMGEMPVSFKAEKNGSYTLNFTAQEVSFAYLHLIDNKTGKDVDLLESPAYSFDALTTDYANRFKLVFATGNNSEDNFAFNSNGLWIISNDGEATLQVVDVTGRILSSETISGSCSKSISAAPGVYMLRLINGDNMKVQKVVVK